jgi:SAM-dependent methyltransferase
VSVTAFTTEWLAMREPFDAAARDASVTKRLSELLRDRALSHFFDLGSGTGANLRHLAPLIAGPQEWVLIDSDERHLEESRALARVWRHRVQTLRSVAIRRVDLAQGLEEVKLETGAIVTASALLDLVSADWLIRLLQQCRTSDAIVLFALSYDGRIDLTPFQADDGWIRDRVNRHQRTDKGFGPALGPEAARFACTFLKDLQYQVELAASDWVLGAPHARLQERLLRGWAQAAQEVAPSEQHRCRLWLQSRLEQVDRGQSSMRVGHQDLIAWLSPSVTAPRHDRAPNA